jgi:hypothetical protein
MASIGSKKSGEKTHTATRGFSEQCQYHNRQIRDRDLAVPSFSVKRTSNRAKGTSVAEQNHLPLAPEVAPRPKMPAAGAFKLSKNDLTSTPEPTIMSVIA